MQPQVEQIRVRLDGLRFRATLWAGIAALIALWFMAAIGAFIVAINQDEGEQFFLEEWLGAAEAVILMSAVGCISLLALVFAAFMSWRNDAALRTERRHLEVMIAQQHQRPYSPQGDVYHDAP